MQTDRVQVLVQATQPPPSDSGLDWLTFISDVIGSLAWPLLVAFLVLTFRKQLTALLESVEEWEGWGAKARFRKRAQALKAEAEVIEARSPVIASADATLGEMTSSASGTAVQASVEELIDPFFRIANAWGRIELRVRRIASEHGVPPSMRFDDMVREMLFRDIINPKTAHLLEVAASLRNEAFHSVATEKSADAFEASARSILRVLENLDDKNQNG